MARLIHWTFIHPSRGSIPDGNRKGNRPELLPCIGDVPLCMGILMRFVTRKCTTLKEGIVYLCLKNSSVCGISSLCILSVEFVSGCSCCKCCILCRIIVEFIGFLILCLSSGAVRYVLGVYLCLYSLIFEGLRERTE